jgi:hypothetical protein
VSAARYTGVIQATYTVQSVSYKWMHGLSGLSENTVLIRIMKVSASEIDVPAKTVNLLSGKKSTALSRMK